MTYHPINKQPEQLEMDYRVT